MVAVVVVVAVDSVWIHEFFWIWFSFALLYLFGVVEVVPQWLEIVQFSYFRFCLSDVVLLLLSFQPLLIHTPPFIANLDFLIYFFFFIYLLSTLLDQHMYI